MAILNNLKLIFAYLLGHKAQIVAAVIEENGKILIAKRKPSGAFGGKWEFPGGKIEPGETPEAALKRELKEEFDIETEVGAFFHLVKFRYYFIPLALVAYKVRHVSGEFKINDHEEIKWVRPEEFSSYDFMNADKPVVRKLLSE